MQLLISLLLGTVMGILFAIPLGPISLFVAQQTMNGNTRNGLRVAAGSIIIDVLYCLIITLGFISLIMPFLLNQYVQLSLSILMIAYGLYMLLKGGRRARPPADALAAEPIAQRHPVPLAAQPTAQRGRAGFAPEPVAQRNGNLHYLLGTTMALANPTLFLSWTAALSFVTANKMLSTYFWDKVVFSFSVGLGNLLWFVALALFVRSKRHVLSQRFIKLMGDITAFVIIGFGIYFAYTILRLITAA